MVSALGYERSGIRVQITTTVVRFFFQKKFFFFYLLEYLQPILVENFQQLHLAWYNDMVYNC